MLKITATYSNGYGTNNGYDNQNNYNYGTNNYGSNFPCVNGNCPSSYICDSNNRCINPLRCPGNTTFQQCATSCRPTCTDPYPQYCTRECFVGCVCNNGYVLDSRNNCILLADCNGNGNGNNNNSGNNWGGPGCPSYPMTPLPSNCYYQLETSPITGCREPRIICSSNGTVTNTSANCGANAHLSMCTSYCPTIYCGNLYKRIVCYSLACGPPGCVCDSGYVFAREDKIGGCVTQQQCSTSGNGTYPPSGNQCGQNEVFQTCGTACEPTCENQRPQACTLECVVNVCQCRSGYVRHRTRGCILPSQCYY